MNKYGIIPNKYILGKIRKLKKGGSTDYDPTDHIHVIDKETGEEKKQVFNEEQMETMRNDPAYSEVLAAIKAEHEKYPEPEYETIDNPAYNSFLVSTQQRTIPNFKVKLPEGYSYDKDGLIVDKEGNTYIQASGAFRNNKHRNGVTTEPAFEAETQQIHGWYPTNFYKIQRPDKTITVEKKPKPADIITTTEDLNKAKKNAVAEYIQTHSTFYNPWIADTIYDAITDKTMTLSEFEKKYPNKGEIKYDRASKTRLYGEPTLPYEKFKRGVEQVLKATGLNDSTDIKNYLKAYKDERVLPSDEEVQKNVRVHFMNGGSKGIIPNISKIRKYLK